MNELKTNELSKYITDERTGLEYELVGDYYLIAGDDEPEEQRHIGKWGMLRDEYLRNHKRAIRSGLVINGKLHDHLADVEEHATEMLSQLDGPEYLERVTVNNVRNIRNAKRAIKKAFQNQLDGKGFSLVEVLSSCPTNWGMTPQKALEWIDEKMIPYYPLGVYKDRSASKEAQA